jgi:hypothetical protein
MSFRRAVAGACLVLLSLAATADAAVVTLAWDPSPQATGYVVHYGTAPGRYDIRVDVGARTSFVRDLPGGARYYFAVSAYNVSGSSALSGEVNASLTVDFSTVPSVDLPFQIAATAIDIAYDEPARRFLIPYAVGGQIWGLLLDVWGNQAGPPFVIVPTTGNAQPRVAGGGGGFLVTYTEDGERRARSIRGVGGIPTVSAAYSLGPAVNASSTTDNTGNGVVYVPASNRFLASWSDGTNVMLRAVNASGTIGPEVGVTTDAGEPNCVYNRSEIAWDPTVGRAMLLGNRSGGSCASGDAVWARLMSFDGNATWPADGLRVVSTEAGPHRFRRLTFSPAQRRFLLAWSEPSGSQTTVAYSVGDATGGMSAPVEIAIGADLTPESEDDSFTENALTVDVSGGFALLSRGGIPSGSSDGQLHLFRIGTDGTSNSGLPQRLPGTGQRMHTAMAANTTTGQMVATYITSDGRLKALTIGTRVTTSLNVTAPAATSMGSALTLSAQAAGGAGPYEYEFWHHHASQGWSRLQAYGSTGALAWTAQNLGVNSFQVWTRSAGSVADFEAWRGFTINVGSAVPRTVTITSNQGTSVPVGTTVTWTAASSGGIGTPQYQFWIYNVGSASWTIGRAWSASNQFAWTATAPGSYTTQVWARATGSTGDPETSANAAQTTVTAPLPMSVTVSLNRLTATPGFPLIWTATARGGVGAYQYQFWRYDTETRTYAIVQPYGTSNTYAWSPGIPDAGRYSVQVWARPVGSSSSVDAWVNSAEATVTNVTVTNLTATSARRVGQSITFTATATRATPTGTIQYQYWLYSSATGTWQIARPWSTSNAWAWTPSTSGSYTVQVWARIVGNTHSYESWRSTSPLTITP